MKLTNPFLSFFSLSLFLLGLVQEPTGKVPATVAAPADLILVRQLE